MFHNVVVGWQVLLLRVNRSVENAMVVFVLHEKLDERTIICLNTSRLQKLHIMLQFGFRQRSQQCVVNFRPADDILYTVVDKLALMRRNMCTMSDLLIVSRRLLRNCLHTRTLSVGCLLLDAIPLTCYCRRQK